MAGKRGVVEERLINLTFVHACDVEERIHSFDKKEETSSTTTGGVKVKWTNQNVSHQRHGIVVAKY